MAGHRRTRSARAVELVEAPAVIRDLTDTEVAELQLIENIQREGLSPIDEAEHLRRLLSLVSPTGERVYSRATVAKRIGRSERHVTNTLLLCNLDGDAREAIADGRLGIVLAYELGKIPDGETRAKAVRQILNPTEGEAPMRYAAGMDWIRRHCTRSLRTEARFKPDDAELVPVRHHFDLDDSPDGIARYMGGSCLDCPFNSAFSGEEGKRGPKLGACSNIACFDAKTAADFERWRAKNHNPDAGKHVVSAERNAELFGPEGGIDWRAGLVPLNSRPDPGLLKTGAVEDPHELPTWAEMTAGKVGEVIIARDPRTGKAVELLEIEKAKAAAELNQHAIFKTSKKSQAPAPGGDREAAHKGATLETRREMDVRDHAQLLVLADLEQRTKALGHLPGWAWRSLAFWVLEGVAAAVLERVAKRRRVDVPALGTLAKDGVEAERIALVVELVAADYFAGANPELAHDFAGAFGVDTAGAISRARVAMMPVVAPIPESAPVPCNPESPSHFVAFIAISALGSDLSGIVPTVGEYTLEAYANAMESPVVAWVAEFCAVDVDAAERYAAELFASGDGCVTSAGREAGLMIATTGRPPVTVECEESLDGSHDYEDGPSCIYCGAAKAGSEVQI